MAIKQEKFLAINFILVLVQCFNDTSVKQK